MSAAPPRPSDRLTTSRQLRGELAGLHEWVGSPGARKLATLASEVDMVLARSTAHDLISGRGNGVPNRDFVRAFVNACLVHAGIAAERRAVEAQRWDQAWLAVVHARGHIPDLPGNGRERKPRSQWRSSVRPALAGASVSAVLFAAAGIFFFSGGERSVPEQHPMLDVHCFPEGGTASWQNHHSKMYIAAVRNGSDSYVGVVESPRSVFAANRVRGDSGCVYQLSAQDLCLETAGDGQVTPTACADHPGQRWVIENHWHNDGVMWRRLHPAHRLDLCLQQQADPRTATTRTVVHKCGPDWIQQWHLHD